MPREGFESTIRMCQCTKTFHALDFADTSAIISKFRAFTIFVICNNLKMLLEILHFLLGMSVRNLKCLC
jgi:hypothetical protein